MMQRTNTLLSALFVYWIGYSGVGVVLQNLKLKPFARIKSFPVESSSHQWIKHVNCTTVSVF
jgi:hypothetical protein